MQSGCLKIDIDPGQPLYSVQHMQRLLARAGYRMRSRTKERSGSGKGWHIRVFIDPVPSSFMEVVALQAILGSDRYREACNVQRVRTLAEMTPEFREFWSQRWNVFYDGTWGR